MLAYARASLLHESHHQRRCGADAADGIAQSRMQHGRRIAVAARHRRQPRRLFERRAIGADAAPRAAHAESRHRHHHEPGIDRMHRLGVEAETRQHVGGIIVDHRVGVGEQTPEQRQALGMSEVERDAALVAVHHLEPIVLFVGAFGVIRPARIGAAKPIRILAGFDLDDICTKVAHLPRRGRPGPAHREIDDTQAFQRQRIVWCRRARRAALMGSEGRTVMLAGERRCAVRQRARLREILRQHRRIERRFADRDRAERAAFAINVLLEQFVHLRHHGQRNP